MELDVTVNTSRCSCSIAAVDQSDFTSLPDGIVFVEFLSYFSYDDSRDSLVPILASKRVSDKESITYSYTTNYDGHYVYSKYGIYDINYLASAGTYLTKNQIFYYNGNIYLGLENITDLEAIDGTNAQIISNWYTLKDYIDSYISYYYTTDFFTLCKLKQCMINHQKQVIEDKLKPCGNPCSEDDTADVRRFLFVTIHVLEYLVCQGNYSEAQRILESVSSCGNLCNNSVYSNTNNCGCK